MLALAFESFWLWYLAGVALWAFVGMLVAARFGLPISAGVGLGALFWIGGIAVLLIVGVAHRGRRDQVRGSFLGEASTTSSGFPRSTPGAGDAFPSAGAGFPQAGAGFPPSSVGFPAAGAGFPPSSAGFGAGGFPDPGFPAASVGYSSGFADIPESTGTVAASPLRSRSRVSFPSSTRQVATAVAVLGALGIFVSILLPWGEGSVAWSKTQSAVHGGVSPASAFPIAFVIALSGVVVVVSGLLMHRRPHIVWPMLAASTTTWWFCVVFEWLFVESHAAGLAGSASHLAGNQAAVSVSTASGVWIMLIACCAIYAWCALVSYDLVRGNSARLSDYSARRQTAFGR